MIGLVLRSKDMVLAALEAILVGAPHCRLISLDGFGTTGHFVQVTEAQLHIHLDEDLQRVDLCPGARVEIITQYRGLAARQACTVEHYDAEGRLYVSLPEEIILADAREYARLALPAHVELSLELIEDQRLEGVRFADVSHGGFRLTGSEEVLADLAPGTVGHCRIGLGEIKVRIDYAIMWKRDDSVGFMVIGMRKVHPREKTHPWVAFLDEVVIAALKNPA